MINFKPVYDESSPYECLDRDFFLQETKTVLGNADYILKDLKTKRSNMLSLQKHISKRSIIERRWNIVNQVKNELLNFETEFKYSKSEIDPLICLHRLYELQNILFKKDDHVEIVDDDEEEIYEEEYFEEYDEFESIYYK